MSGCAGFRPGGSFSSQLNSEQREEVITVARARIHQSGLLTADEYSLVQASAPSMSYYFLAGKEYAQYSISWPLLNGEKIIISNQGGPILTLDKASVERQLVTTNPTELFSK